MNPPTTRSRAATALVTGVATALYYATPDAITSRTARGWVKAALTGVTLAASVPDFRATRAAARGQSERDGAAEPLSDALTSSSTRTEVTAVGVLLVVVTVLTTGLVQLERWIFRRGEARAAAGERLPHTRAAVLLGLLGAALSLLPPPPGPPPTPGATTGRLDGQPSATL